MRHITLISIVILCSLYAKSQPCTFHWEPHIYDFFNPDLNTPATSRILDDLCYDMDNIFLVGKAITDSIEGWGARYIIKIDKENCQEMSYVINEGRREEFLHQLHLRDDRLYHISLNGKEAFESDSIDGWRYRCYLPSSLISINIDNPMDFSKHPLSKDGYVFSLNKPSLEYLDNHDLFYSSATVIKTENVEAFLNNPIDSFEYIKPAWLLFDSQSNILEYKVLGVNEKHFISHKIYHEIIDDKLYMLGGELRNDMYPASFEYNGLKAVFDVETRQFDYIDRIFPNQDTFLRASTVYWDNGGFVFDGIMGTGLDMYEIDQFHFVTEFWNVAGRISFTGEKDIINAYQDMGEGYNGWFYYNDIFHRFEDGSFLKSRIAPVDIRRNESLDSDHFWVVHVSNEGHPIDTLRIRHNLEYQREILSCVEVDSFTNDLYLAGEVWVENTLVVPEPRFPFLIKMPFSDILDLISSSEGPIEKSPDGLKVFPTIFQDRINLLNQSGQPLTGKFRLLNQQGIEVYSSKIELSTHEYYPMTDFGGLSSGTYFYIYEELGKKLTGQLIKT